MTEMKGKVEFAQNYYNGRQSYLNMIVKDQSCPVKCGYKEHKAVFSIFKLVTGHSPA